MSLSSKLNNRVEVWGNVEVKNEVGAWTNEPKFIKKIWADIIPRDSYNSMKDGESNTKYSNSEFKIKIRYNAYKDLKEDNWIMYKGQRYEIIRILPDYNNREFKHLFCNIITE